MIKFFRHFRQRMIKDNKLSKYMLYAIGEIVLVVIGILIALQINEWNGQRKNAILESDYYCRLLEDLQQDREQTDALIAQAEARLKASNQAIRLLHAEKTKSIAIGEQIGKATRAIYIDFKPNNSTFEDLKSSNLNIIKDKSVIKALNNYYSTVESLKSIILVNGENAVNVSFGHADNFATGETQASMTDGNLKRGMEQDVYDLFTLDTTEVLSEKVKQQLMNEVLIYLGSNTRQLQLYRIIRDNASNSESLLLNKCKAVL